MPPKCETHNEFWSRQRDGKMACSSCLSGRRKDHRDKKTQTGHTPGPFIVMREDRYYVKSPEGVLLAEVLPTGKTPGNERGNAALFAAAPDLLAALEELVDGLIDAEQDCDEDGEQYEDVKAALAAIRKARGQA